MIEGLELEDDRDHSNIAASTSVHPSCPRLSGTIIGPQQALYVFKILSFLSFQALTNPTSIQRQENGRYILTRQTFNAQLPNWCCVQA